MNPSCEPLSSMWASVGWKHTLLTVRLCSVNSWSCLFLEGFPRFQVTTAPLVAAVASRFSSIWCHITSAQLKLRDGLRPTRRFSFSTNCSSSNVYILKILRPATTTCVASRHTLIALAGASKWQNIVRPLMVLLLPRAVVTLDIFSIFLMQKNLKFTGVRFKCFMCIMITFKALLQKESWKITIIIRIFKTATRWCSNEKICMHWSKKKRITGYITLGTLYNNTTSTLTMSSALTCCRITGPVKVSDSRESSSCAPIRVNF